jgi:hypothetical protein
MASVPADDDGNRDCRESEGDDDHDRDACGARLEWIFCALPEFPFLPARCSKHLAGVLLPAAE